MLARFCSLLTRWWVSLMGLDQTSAIGRVKRRRLCLEQCEQRVVFAGTDYVSALYWDILNRAADQSGLDAYNYQLHHGASQEQVANSIWNSVEHRGIEVDGFYKTLLHRNADPVGRQYYIDQLRSGVSEESVMLTIATSGEYIQRNPLGEAYINALYHDVLGRDADAEGLASWLDQLKAADQVYSSTDTYHKDQVGVAWNFIHSHERHTQIIFGHYDKNLLRDPDPDGEADWVNKLDQGAREDAVALAFMTCLEYRTDYPIKSVFA